MSTKNDQSSWRDGKTTAQRGYGSRWQRARATFLSRNPLCVMCEKEGRITVAQVVDHIKPHKGDQSLFWDRGNWQSICASHHNRDKQRVEKGGKEGPRFGPDGRVIWDR